MLQEATKLWNLPCGRLLNNRGTNTGEEISRHTSRASEKGKLNKWLLHFPYNRVFDSTVSMNNTSACMKSQHFLKLNLQEEKIIKINQIDLQLKYGKIIQIT